MVATVVIDAGGTPLDELVWRLKRLSDKPRVYVLPNEESPSSLGAGINIFISENPASVNAARAEGYVGWLVSSDGSNQLDDWDEAPLAVAFAGGGLTDVRSEIELWLKSKGGELRSISWTPEGNASGTAFIGGKDVPLFASSDLTGENPKIYIGPEAEEWEKSASLFAKQLQERDAISSSGQLRPWQTHSFKKDGERRPQLKRERFELS